MTITESSLETHDLDDDLSNPIDPTRKVLYLTTPGSRVANQRGRFIVTNSEGERLLEVPERLVGAIVCNGAINLTSGVIEHVLKHDIHTVFLTRRGQHLGSLRSSDADDAGRLRAQVDATADPDFTLPIATSIVNGKIHNMRTLLMRFTRSDQHLSVRSTLDRLDTLASRALDCTTTNEAMGVEGAATADYFSCWPRLLPDWTNFTHRRRRPPPDPVNAMLGFGGTLLSSFMTGAVAAARLQPTLGVLHADAHQRPSLALDLVEEFRPLIVDQVVLHLTRKGSIGPDHFQPGDEPDAIWLTDTGRRIFLNAFEHRLNQAFHYTPLQRTVTYRRAMHLQAQQFSLAVRRGKPHYEPVHWHT